MDIKEILEKVDKAKLQEALTADDPDALKKLFEDEDIKLTDEELDYIAGGGYGLPNPLGQTC